MYMYKQMNVLAIDRDQVVEYMILRNWVKDKGDMDKRALLKYCMIPYYHFWSQIVMLNIHGKCEIQYVLALSFSLISSLIYHIYINLGQIKVS